MGNSLDSGDSKLCLPGVCVTAFPRGPALPSPTHRSPFPRRRGRGAQGACSGGAAPRGSGEGCAAPPALPALPARPGKGTISSFPPLRQGEGDREVLRRERACAGSDVRERRSRFLAAALSKVRVKCDTPAKWEQEKLPASYPCCPSVPPGPPALSMETRKRRRSRVCYGKVSPWAETVSGVSGGSELPVSGEEAGREGGRSYATYIFPPPSSWSYFIPEARTSTPPPSPGWSAEMRLCALIPSRALKQNPLPRSRQRLGAPRRWSAAGRSEAGYRGAGRRLRGNFAWKINLHRFPGDPRENRKARLRDLSAAAACCNFTFCLPWFFFLFVCLSLLSFWNR